MTSAPVLRRPIRPPDRVSACVSSATPGRSRRIPPGLDSDPGSGRHRVKVPRDQLEARPVSHAAPSEASPWQRRLPPPRVIAALSGAAAHGPGRGRGPPRARRPPLQHEGRPGGPDHHQPDPASPGPRWQRATVSGAEVARGGRLHEVFLAPEKGQGQPTKIGGESIRNRSLKEPLYFNTTVKGYSVRRVKSMGLVQKESVSRLR